MSARSFESMMRARVESARYAIDLIGAELRGDTPPALASFEIVLLDLLGFAEAAVEVLDPPAVPERPAVTLRGERVEIPTPTELVPDPHVAAFFEIAAFIGMAGRDASTPADALVREVGRIVARVNGVPNPLADDTEAHYRREAERRLSGKQRKMLGVRKGGEA